MNARLPVATLGSPSRRLVSGEMAASSSAAHVEEVVAPITVTAYGMLKPRNLNLLATDPTMTCAPARVHRGHHDVTGRFVVHPAFLSETTISWELFAIAQQSLALAVKLTPPQGPPQLLGTFGKQCCMSVESCHVGNEPAIRIIDSEMTLNFRSKLLPVDALRSSKLNRGALNTWPEPLRLAFYSQPTYAWWVLIFSEKAERDRIFAEIFGHGLLGAVARLPIARCSDDRQAIARALHCLDANHYKETYALDPRPQVDGHKPFDEYFRRGS